MMMKKIITTCIDNNVEENCQKTCIVDINGEEEGIHEVSAF